MKSIYTVASGAFLAFIFTSIGLANAEESKTSKSQPSASASALIVIKDKETGELRAPTAEEAAQMRQNTQNLQSQTLLVNSAMSEVAGKVEYHNNGMTSMVVDPSRFEYISAKSNNKGKVTLQHGDHSTSNKTQEEQ